MAQTRTLLEDTVPERATGAFRRKGYAGTSLQDLTLAARLSATALYHRRTNRDGLLVRALRRDLDEGVVEQIARLPRPPKPTSKGSRR